MINTEFVIENNILTRYNGDGGDVIIPDGVKIIGEFAFCDCDNLTSIIIPDSVELIGGYAFWGCTGLTSVNIPNSVKVICKNAFENCTRLTSISIPNSIEKIGEYAFEHCIRLTSITIPDSVKIIGNYAFENCISLTSVNISNSIEKIGIGAFCETKIKHKPEGNIAYKGFNDNMTCLGFQYEEGKTYECDKAELCECGFHACLNPLDCFNYYAGEHVVYHEVILEEQSGEKDIYDSKICGRKITIGRRLTLNEMSQIFNELNK